MKSEDVIFVCGSDEHGVPITIKARQEGVSPQQIVDKYHEIIKDSFKEFGISFDIYHRTTSATHYRTATTFFKTLFDNKKLIEKMDILSNLNPISRGFVKTFIANPVYYRVLSDFDMEVVPQKGGSSLTGKALYEIIFIKH
jgi:valyl-tRNA synthetase